jgi:protein phosphatase
VRGKIRSVGLTDVGRVREHNEDTIGVDADIGLFVLADGMGGYNAGEVASGIAVKTVMSLVKEAVEHQDMSSADPETGMARPSIVLRDAIARANKIIYQTAKTQPQCEGMGTTSWPACSSTIGSPSRTSGIPGCTASGPTASSR